MTYQLLDVYKRAARKCGQDPTITEFSDNDESLLLVDYLNDGIQILADSVSEVPELDQRGTIETVDGTRLYSVAATANTYNLHAMSFMDTTDADNPGRIPVVELKSLQANTPNYMTHQGKPVYVYYEGSSVGVYPVPDGVYTLTYIYEKTIQRKEQPTDIMELPDPWCDFVVDFAAAMFLSFKGFSGAAELGAQAQRKLNTIIAQSPRQTRFM